MEVKSYETKTRNFGYENNDASHRILTPRLPVRVIPIDEDEIRVQHHEGTLQAHLRDRYSSVGWNWMLLPSPTYTRSIFCQVEIRDVTLDNDQLLILWR